MSKLNFTRNIALEKEELIQFQNFLTDNTQRSLFEAISSDYGIIPQADLSGDDFLVVAGSTSGTIQIADNSVAVDSDLLLLSLTAFDNYPIPNDSVYYWLKISHRYYNVETGTVSINTSGEVSGTGTAFTELLRNQTTGSPIKIRFYQEDVEQNPVTVANDSIYEIVEIINDGSMILAGSFTAESNLRYIIVGSISLGTAITSEQEEGIYSYDSCTLDLVAESVVDTPPTSGFTQGKDFYIARVRNVGGTVSISDKRGSYYWTLDLGVTLPSKADRDAVNITTSDTLLWLTKLLVYQNNYVSLTVTSTPVTYDLTDLQGLVEINGNTTSFDYHLRLPALSNANKGKVIFITYDLTDTTGSSVFTVDDNDDNILFGYTWTNAENRSGFIVVKNNGSSWGLLHDITYKVATTAEAQAGTNNTSVITPARLQDVTSTSTRAGIIEKATNYESQIGEADKNITADLFQSESAIRATNADAANGTFSSKWISCSVLKYITGGIRRKVVTIGNWNMDALSQILIPHGENIADIIGMSCIIRNDTDTIRVSLIGDSVGTAALGWGSSMNVTSTNIVLNRITGGQFDNTSYDSTSYNRGWVILDLLT